VRAGRSSSLLGRWTDDLRLEYAWREHSRIQTAEGAPLSRTGLRGLPFVFVLLTLIVAVPIGVASLLVVLSPGGSSRGDPPSKPECSRPNSTPWATLALEAPPLSGRGAA
jgi:hypothetical protein